MVRFSLQLCCITLCFLILAAPALAQEPEAQPSDDTTPEAPPPETSTIEAQSPTELPIAIKAEGFVNPNFARIIFRTNTQNFLTNLQGDRLTITFGKPVTIDTSNVTRVLHGHITSTSVSADQKALILQLISPLYKTRQFIGENFVGVDLIPDSKTNTGSVKTEPVSIIPAKRKTQHVPITTPSGKQTYITLSSKPSSFLPYGKRTPTEKPEFFKPDIAEAPQPESPDTIATGEEEIIEVQSEDIMGPPTAEQAAKQQKKNNKNFLIVGRNMLKDGIALSFPWQQEVAAASFVRGQVLWVIFDKPTALDLSTIKGIKYINSIKQIKHRYYTILAIHIASDYRATNQLLNDALPLHTQLSKENYVWSLILRQIDKENAALISHASNPITIDSGTDEKGNPKVILSTTKLSEPLTITDIEIGDSLIIIPSYKSEVGVTPSRNYVDFSLPQTSQGIVVRKIADGMEYNIFPYGLEITSIDGLNLSPALFKNLSNNRLLAPRSHRMKKIVLSSETAFPFRPYNLDSIDFSAPVESPEDPEGDEEEGDEEEGEEEGNQEGDEEESEEEGDESESEETATAQTIQQKPLRLEDMPFIELRQTLYDKLIATADKDKTTQRLEIAKFYFQEGFYHESLGVLREIKIIDPIYNNMHEVDLIIAANHYLLRRYREAEENFVSLMEESGDTVIYNELALWHWASRYQLSKGTRKQDVDEMPIDYIASYDKFMQHYPEVLRYEFGLLAVEYLLEKEELETASTILEIIGGEGIPPKYVNHTKFLYAIIALMNDNIDEASTLWKELSDQIDDRYNRARAAFELSKLRLIHGQIDVKEAVDTFYQLGVVWRGDGLELEMLKLAGQLYIRQEQYLKGLRVWQVLVQNFPNTKEALYIAGKMKKTFIKLFDEGKAYNMEPFEALSLFFEFRELTPVGERGDRIIQQLADHFIEADLLDNASALIMHQIQYRVTGTKKNELILKLCDLHLSNNKPQLVMETLEYLDKDIASEETLKVAKYLRANALVALQQHDDVFSLLEDDFSPEAQTVRLEVFWNQKNWFGIIDIVESRMENMHDSAPFPLKENEVDDLVKLALAYGIQEEREKLRKLSNDFAHRIDSEKVQEIFGFVTHDIPEVSHQQFEETVQLDEIESFMNEYAFWPGKDWLNVISVLEPHVKELMRDDPPLTVPEQQDVIRLGIAYAMRMKQETDEKKFKGLERALSILNRDFRKVTVNRNTWDVLKILDDKFVKIQEDVIFEGEVPIKDIPTLVEQYQAAQSLSELNAVLQ